MIEAEDSNNNNNSTCTLIEKKPSSPLPLTKCQNEDQEHEPLSSPQEAVKTTSQVEVQPESSTIRSQESSDPLDFIFEDDMILDDIELLVDIYLLFENSRWILKGFLW